MGYSRAYSPALPGAVCHIKSVGIEIHDPGEAMQALANLIVAALDLLELEGRALHRGVMRMVWKLLALIGTGVVALAGAAFVAVSLLMLLAAAIHWMGASMLVSWAIATALVGVVLASGAFGLYLYARSLPVRRQSVIGGIDAKSPEERALDAAIDSAQDDVRPMQPKQGATHATAVS
jgi:hypothetical protein